MQRRRTPEELKIIDKFIAENYPDKGPDFCASHLKLGLPYIVSRACLKQIKFNKPEAQKYETKLEEIERLKNNNAALRKENIKLIVKNKSLEIKEAFKVVGPVAALCGVDPKDIEMIINYVNKMTQEGISGAQAGQALRVVLKNKLKGGQYDSN